MAAGIFSDNASPSETLIHCSSFSFLGGKKGNSIAETKGLAQVHTADRRIMREPGIHYTRQVSQFSARCFFYETIQPQVTHSLAAYLWQICPIPCHSLSGPLLSFIFQTGAPLLNILSDMEGGIRICSAPGLVRDLSFSFL